MTASEILLSSAGLPGTSEWEWTWTVCVVAWCVVLSDLVAAASATRFPDRTADFAIAASFVFAAAAVAARDAAAVEIVAAVCVRVCAVISA